MMISSLNVNALENPMRTITWVNDAAEQGLAGANGDFGMRYLTTAESMRDSSSQQWLNENCLNKPQWLIDMTEQTKSSE